MRKLIWYIDLEQTKLDISEIDSGWRIDSTHMLGLEKSEGEEQVKNNGQYMAWPDMWKVEWLWKRVSWDLEEGAPLKFLLILRNGLIPEVCECYAIPKLHFKTD